MNPFSKLGAAWQSFRSAAIVGKSAFAAAFIRGQDMDGVFSAGKMLDPYAQSAWVHRAIRLKVDEITRIPLKFYAGDVEFTDPAFAAWWKTPFLSAGHQPMTLAQARQSLASWPDLAGEFFIVLGDDWLAPFASRRWQSLSRPIIARPDRMRHVVQGGQLVGWVFTDAGAQQHPLLPEQVIHSPVWNPHDDFRGISTVKVAFNAAEADYLAGLYVRNLMRNNGDQGVYVVAKGGVVGDEQREQITAALREKRARSLRGDFAPVFLTGDITVQDPTAKSTDTEFNAGRILNRHEIYVALGVPPSMADVKASYSIGADSDRFMLITGGSMPLSAAVDAAFSRLASIMTGRDIEAESDWDDHPVIQEVRRGRIDGALKLWAVGMPMEKANAYFDLGMQPFPGWEQGYLPFSVAPTGGGEVAAVPADPVADPEFSEDAADDAMPDDMPGDDAMKSLRLLVLARSRAAQMKCRAATAEESRVEKEFGMFTCSAHGEAGVAQRANRPPAEIARWRALIAQRRTTVKSFQSAVSRVLMQARIETLRKIEQYHPDAQKTATPPVAKAAASTFTFNLADLIGSFHSAMENQQKAALQTAGDQLFDELKKDDVFTMPPAKVLEYLRARENKLRGVPQSVYDRVKASIEEGLNKGDTQAELAGRVKTIFNGMADVQARTIALTETSAVYGAGRDAAMKHAGVQYKAWLTSGNPNVRPAHEQAGLDYPFDRGIAIDEPFVVDGEELMFPGDDAGSPGNTINCHCISIAVAGAGEDES